MKTHVHDPGRRRLLRGAAAMGGVAALGGFLPAIARAQSERIRLGLMLPFTGTYAQLGVAIENGLRLAVDEKGGKLGGRQVEYFKVDD